jgi:hypothetical protein
VYRKGYGGFMMSKLGMVVGVVTKKTYDFCNNKVWVVVEGFKIGYAMGISEVVLADDTVIVNGNDIVHTVPIKVGILTGKLIVAFKNALAKARAWYKKQMTVVTEGTIEEHKKSVADRIRNVSSVLVHGVCAVVSTLAFGLSHWFTLSIASSMIFTMWTI